MVMEYEKCGIRKAGYGPGGDMITDEIRLKKLQNFRPEMRTDIRFSSPGAGRSLVLYGWLNSMGMHEMFEKMSGW
jgi:hypothetical protein